MAYVPPHRRIRDGSSSSFTPTPAAQPPFGRYNRGGRQRGRYRGYVRNNFRKWFAVDENGDPSSLLLKFKPFHGETYEKLRDKKLYTLFADSAVNEGADVENNLPSSAINEASPWKRICERFKDNIREEFVNVQSYIEASKPDHEKPTFLIRLGKNLFRGETAKEMLDKLQSLYLGGKSQILEMEKNGKDSTHIVVTIYLLLLL